MNTLGSFGKGTKIACISILLALVLVTVIFFKELFISRKSQPNDNPRPVSSQEQVYTSTEYGFSVTIPPGWSFDTTPEEVGDSMLVVQLKLQDEDGKIFIPIFAKEQSWDSIKRQDRKNFLPEAIEETMLAGQPAYRILAATREINPGYTFRIKHSTRKDTVVVVTAALIRERQLSTVEEIERFPTQAAMERFATQEQVDRFRETVTTILNSIRFIPNDHVN